MNRKVAHFVLNSTLQLHICKAAEFRANGVLSSDNGNFDSFLAGFVHGGAIGVLLAPPARSTLGDLLGLGSSLICNDSSSSSHQSSMGD